MQILESCVKNCGTPFHLEVATKAFMEELHELAKVTTNDKVREKVLELIQTWAHAFRDETSYRVIQETVDIMKAEGHKFPLLKESDAMFISNVAPQWADGDCCHRCRVQFNVVQRKHHCRNCGQIFCAKCSKNHSIIPKYGIEKPVRVCEDCYEKLNKPYSYDSKTKQTSSNQVSSPKSSENSKPSSQSQTKTDEELQEEEDLQMAIALSKSEAESKEKLRNQNLSDLTSSYFGSSTSKKSETSNKVDPELEKYLDRGYWEKKAALNNERSKSPAPSAPHHYTTKVNLQNSDDKTNYSTPLKDKSDKSSDIDSFLATLKSAIEIFVNRLNSNRLRGRPIANDSAAQSLFLNITNMHSQLLKYIQEQDDARAHYECLQDKLSQIRDSRAALDALREEHQEKLRLEAEEAERARQQQMAQKLEIMRKKKAEYLQYQRQMALQRIQEEERELLLRQEQQKYIWQQQPRGTVPYTRTHIPYTSQPNMYPGPIPQVMPGSPHHVMQANLGPRPGLSQNSPGAPLLRAPIMNVPSNMYAPNTGPVSAPADYSYQSRGPGTLPNPAMMPLANQNQIPPNQAVPNPQMNLVNSSAQPQPPVGPSQQQLPPSQQPQAQPQQQPQQLPPQSTTQAQNPPSQMNQFPAQQVQYNQENKINTVPLNEEPLISFD